MRTTLIWVAIGIDAVVALGVAAGMTGNGDAFGAVLLMAILSAAYMFPTIIAAVAHARLIGPVVVVNLFLGWTLIGWVVALAMAVGGSAPRPRDQAGLPPAGTPIRQDQVGSGTGTICMRASRFVGRRRMRLGSPGIRDQGPSGTCWSSAPPCRAF
jgi:hypothetical protein